MLTRLNWGTGRFKRKAVCVNAQTPTSCYRAKLTTLVRPSYKCAKAPWTKVRTGPRVRGFHGSPKQRLRRFGSNTIGICAIVPAEPLIMRRDKEASERADGAAAGAERRPLGAGEP